MGLSSRNFDNETISWELRTDFFFCFNLTTGVEYEYYPYNSHIVEKVRKISMNPLPKLHFCGNDRET